MTPARAAFLCLALLPLPAAADGFVMGAGRWTCAEALRVGNRGSAAETGQLAGWIAGFWSAASFGREQGFIDTVERVGAEAIFRATLTECAKAAPDTPVYRVAQEMIRNTR